PPDYGTEGLRAAVQLRAQRPQLRTLVLSAHLETRHLAALLEDGRARGVGYLLKERVDGLDKFVEAVNQVAAGKYLVDEQVVAAMLKARRLRISHLTQREKEVLALVAEGHSNTSIAALLNLKLRGVESHIRNIFVKLDLPPTDDYDRRVLAVLKYLQGRGSDD
ncbi:response regulator transcription factor, partial [Streptomyces sp. NPDC049099]|uniref:response regulator transcription factor n=1 Tax=Streptomyces sp. NPDC049099 TaxID=3155768 RepID=UPI0034400641